MECAGHTEPGFLQDEVSSASCITLWFDGKLQGHTVGTGEETSTSSCPKGALEGQGPLSGQGLGRQHPSPVWCGSCSPPLWETSPASKRLSKENHFWQPLGDGRCPLTAPLLASAMAVTVLSLLSARQQESSSLCSSGPPPVQLWLLLCKPARAAVPRRPPLPAFLLAQDIGNLVWMDPCLSGAEKGDQPVTHRVTLHRWGASALAVTRRF